MVCQYFYNKGVKCSKLIVFDEVFYGEIFGVMVVSGDYNFFWVFQDDFFEVWCIFVFVDEVKSQQVLV